MMASTSQATQEDLGGTGTGVGDGGSGGGRGLFGLRGRSANGSGTVAAGSTNDGNENSKKSSTPRPAVGAGALRLLGAGMQRLEMGLEDLGAVLSDEADRHQIDGHRLAALRSTVQTSVHSLNEPETGRISRLRSTVGETASKVGKGVRGVTQSAVQTASTASERVLQHQQSSFAHSDDLESLRRRMQDEKQVLEAENMTREAEEACLNVCRLHLQEFLKEKPDGTYEDWLRALHPENDYEGKLLEGFSELDHRFYVKESDHLKMWNESVDEEIKNRNDGNDAGEVQRQKVEARYRLGGHEEDKCTVDLLDMGDSTATQNDGIGGSIGGAMPSTAGTANAVQGNLDLLSGEANSQPSAPSTSNGSANELLLDFNTGESTGSRDIDDPKAASNLVYDKEHDVMDDIDLL